MIYVTGDIHADLRKREKLFRSYTADDILIVLGDFSYSWDSYTEQEWDAYKFPFTTLAVLGNHENYSSIYDSYPKVKVFGGAAYKFNQNTFYLVNGEVYEIGGYRWLCFGGALSPDWKDRIPYVSWWKQELPTQEDYKRALKNAHDIDFLITHACSKTELDAMFPVRYFNINDPTSKMIEDIVKVLLQTKRFKRHLFGHMHKNLERDFGTYKANCLYGKVLSAKEKKLPRQ
jgi:predicted phosphohydrolase